MNLPHVEKKEIPPLLHSPLVEAIFEIRWELQTDPENRLYRDPSYPMMYGRLYERMKQEFPVLEDLPSNQMSPETSPYVIRHRMRREKEGYPLVQIGPGIVTVNDAKNYSWKSFSELIKKAVESIAELYPIGTLPLNFIKADLRYLNALPIDLQKERPLEYLSGKMHTKLELPQELYALTGAEKEPNALNFMISQTLSKPVSNLVFSIGLGQFEGKSSYLMQTAVSSFGETVPHDAESFDVWLKNAHDAAENSFMAFCKGPLLDKFCGSV